MYGGLVVATCKTQDSQTAVTQTEAVTCAVRWCTLGEEPTNLCKRAQNISLTFKRRIKSRLPFAGIIRSSPYSTRFQDKG